MMRQAGRLDRQILVERLAEVGRDPDTNQPIIDYVPLSYLPGSPAVAERYWAEVLDNLPSTSEAVAQGLQVARNQSRIRMRWRDDIDSSMRITVFGDTNRVYQIVAGPAEIAGRKGMLEMVVERYSSGG